MNINEIELEKEKTYLKNTCKILNSQIRSYAKDLYEDESKQENFKKYMWENRAEFDPTEQNVLYAQNELELNEIERKVKHFRKLYKIRKNPYFGKITFDDYEETEDIYIGLTFLTDKTQTNLIYDWRAPICSMFYDYETGYAEYEAPGGVIRGQILTKRQFSIEDRRFKRIFDNNLNINDELLQEVLANKSSEKMKNIVNTIQQEQNKVIRNTTDSNLIVQGIAGSGKTSVALHRIAFLLYKIDNLSSKDVLIFSPNNVFSEYISNVLPELGEENTKETTFYDFLSTFINEYEKIESFTNFLERHYKGLEKNKELVKFKQSDNIISAIEDYVKEYSDKIKFNDGFLMKEMVLSSNELDTMFHDRYSHMTPLLRIEAMANALNNRYFKVSKKVAIQKWLKDRINMPLDIMTIYRNFYMSESFKKYFKGNITDEEIKKLKNKESLNYEDACPFVYLKGLIHEFPYNYDIKETVIDEAQDYNKLQYIILKKLLRKSNFTLLGDINQTINPYYQYSTLKELKELFDANYFELSKTYRSSPEIIEHTNKILDLNFVSAIRRESNVPVIFKKENVLLNDLTEDIEKLKSACSSIAVSTKTDEEAEELYKLLNNKVSDLTLISNSNSKFRRDLVIIPSYLSKGLEFDGTIVYTHPNNKYTKEEKYLYYVACTRSQHHLIIYNQKELV